MTESETQKKVEVHEKILFGDPVADPPRMGMMQVLQEMHRTMIHDEHGNVQLHKRLSSQELNDAKRVAWIKGAKWIITLILTGLGVLLGYSIHH